MAYRLKNITPDMNNSLNNSTPATNTQSDNLIYSIDVIVATIPDKLGNYHGEVLGDGVSLYGGTYGSVMDAYVRLWAWVHFHYETV